MAVTGYPDSGYLQFYISGSDEVYGLDFDDPQSQNAKFKNFTLLFQLDSDDHIMWGDMGVANFFILPDDLARKDFSKVMYNWDCC